MREGESVMDKSTVLWKDLKRMFYSVRKCKGTELIDDDKTEN